MTETQLREGFARLAEPVVPAPQAYNRLLKRGRRRRRVRVMTWTGVLAALIAGPLALGAGGIPNLGPVLTDDPLTTWTQRFLDAPAVGDPALALGIERQITAPADYPQAKVAYVDDVGELRVAFVILHSATGATGRWLYARRGASEQDMAQVLADGDGITETFEPDQPFVSTRIESALGRAAALLAPPGCQIATAPLNGGKYNGALARALTRLYADASQRWRVICDGSLAFEGPAWRAVPQRTTPTAGDLNVAMQDTRGRPDRDLSWIAFTNFDTVGNGFALDRPVIRYSDNKLAVAIAPVSGGWKIAWAALWDGMTRIQARTVPWDLRSLDASLVIAPDPERLAGDLFVLGPENADKVRLAGSADTWTLDADGSARITVPPDAWPSAQLEFLSGEGIVIGQIAVQPADPLAAP